MKPDSDVISVCGKYNIYYEHYKPGGAAKTAIMVNGAWQLPYRSVRRFGT
jgi:hypothetical protein